MKTLLFLLLHLLVSNCQVCKIITERRCDETTEPTYQQTARDEQGLPGKRGPVGHPGPMGPQGSPGSQGPPADLGYIFRELNQTLETILQSWKEELFPKSCRAFRNGMLTLFSGETVFCDNGWRVFQRRFDGSLPFQRKTWQDFQDGFGSLTGEFWIGLETLHKITKNSQCRLRIDLLDRDEDFAYAEYQSFSVGSKLQSYRLRFGEYIGSAGDAMTGDRSFYNLNNTEFSTADVDNDRNSGNCAATRGAFWHNSCGYGRLNAKWLPNSSSSSTISWYFWKNRWGGVTSTMMKVLCK